MIRVENSQLPDTIHSEVRKSMIKSDAEALLRQGIELYDLGRYQEAIVMFDRALALFPDLSKAYYFKGIALYDLGKYEEAIDSYDHVVAIDPSSS